MDDYPNNASENWLPEPPEERVEQEQKEKTKVLTSIGVIKDVLEWFEANAEFYSSVESLGITETTSSDDAKFAVLLSKKLKSAFESKASSFKRDFAQYLKEATEVDSQEI